MGGPASAGGRFVWPPGPPAGPVVAAEAGSPRLERGFAALVTPRGARWRRAVIEAERAWLGLVHPPVWLRVMEAGWRPDGPGAYCGRCGATRRPGDADPGDGLGCGHCAGKRTRHARLVRLGAYDGVLRELIRGLKFGGERGIGRTVGRLLGLAVRDALERAKLDAQPVTIVPMPTTWLRRMDRGVDHALVLARGVRDTAGGRIARPIARRHRPSQTNVTPGARARNVSGAFWSRGEASGPGVVVLVDDVVTSGATVRAACRALRKGWGLGTGGVRPRLWVASAAVAGSAAGLLDDGKGLVDQDLMTF